MSKDERPIIIKRGPRAKASHHGGAWKLAYADFMTAMMAFFLLMWLLGSVNTATLSGIADYFKMPLRTALLGGKKTSEGANILQAGGPDITRADGDVRHGDDRSRPISENTSALPIRKDGAGAAHSMAMGRFHGQDHGHAVQRDKNSPYEDTKDDQAIDTSDMARLRDLQVKLENVFDANAALSQYRKQILMDITRDGLRIQIVDTQKRPMFATASAQVEPYMRDILREIGKALNGVPNSIMLSGHTDAQPYAGGEKGYSNWELSADRANASRRELIAGGMDEGKVTRVVGMASTQNLVRDNPFDATNRRITIFVLNRRAEKVMNGDDDKSMQVADQAGAGAAGVAQAAKQTQGPAGAAAHAPAGH